MACIDTALQHQVGLLQLIPEEKICLRELNLYGVALLGIVGTQHVQAAEHPATPGGFLVGNALFRSLNTEIGVEGTSILMVHGQGIDAVGCDGIDQRTVDGLGLLLFLDITQHLAGDASRLGLCLGHRQTGEAKHAKKRFSHPYVFVFGYFFFVEMWKVFVALAGVAAELAEAVFVAPPFL